MALICSLISRSFCWSDAEGDGSLGMVDAWAAPGTVGIGRVEAWEEVDKSVGEDEREQYSGEETVKGVGEGTWRAIRRRRTSCCEERSWRRCMESVLLNPGCAVEVRIVCTW